MALFGRQFWQERGSLTVHQDDLTWDPCAYLNSKKPVCHLYVKVFWLSRCGQINDARRRKAVNYDFPSQVQPRVTAV